MSKFKKGDKVYLSRLITDDDWGDSCKASIDLFIGQEFNIDYTNREFNINVINIKFGYASYYFPEDCFELVESNFINTQLNMIKDIILNVQVCIVVNNHEERNILAKLYNEVSKKYKITIYKEDSKYKFCKYFFDKEKDRKEFCFKTNKIFSESYNFSDLIKPILEYYEK